MLQCIPIHCENTGNDKTDLVKRSASLPIVITKALSYVTENNSQAQPQINHPEVTGRTETPQTLEN